MSRDKGQRGEREVLAILQGFITEVVPHGTVALKRNTLQSDGGGFDIVADTGFFPYAVEVKFQETLSVDKWWAQTVEQADKYGKTPILFYRKSRSPWKVIVRLDVSGVVITPTLSVEDWGKLFKIDYRTKVNCQRLSPATQDLKILPKF